MAQKKKRPYAMTYTAEKNPRRYLLSGIPPELWKSFQSRCKRERVAMRQVILKAVERWTARPERTV